MEENHLCFTGMVFNPQSGITLLRSVENSNIPTVFVFSKGRKRDVTLLNNNGTIQLLWPNGEVELLMLCQEARMRKKSYNLVFKTHKKPG